ncbi:hypothetical protein FJZ18_01350 [Candidatus Pacearchaeota archaeon]|nr:hypothetical protein [Candidatus Pacearchaeota archaeon]
MKKVVGIVALVVALLLIISFLPKSEKTGLAVSSGTGTMSNPVKAGACGQAPFSDDPRAQKCGKGCCFSGQSCYKEKVCCNADEDGDSLPGIVYYCKKKCDASKGQMQCGEICCDKNKKEVCKVQGLGDKEHGVCLTAKQAEQGCNVAARESACPPKGETIECCTANQECKFKKMGLPGTPGFLKKTIWGCSVIPEKGCGSDVLCQGTGDEFNEYAICCKNGDVCAKHPNGQPYCRGQNKVTTSSGSGSGDGFFCQVFGWC